MRSPPRMFRRGVAIVALACGCLLPVITSAAPTALHALWMPASMDQGPARVLSEVSNGRWTAFDPATLKAIPRQPDGAWVALEPADGAWPPPPLVLSIETPPLGTFSLFTANDEILRKSLLDLDREGLHGHGRVAFGLLEPLLPGEQVLLRFEPYQSLSGPVTFKLQPATEFVDADARWLAFASACFAVMLAMAFMAICFGTLLRDIAFFFYAAYMICYVLIQSIQTGYIAQPLGIAMIAESPVAWGRSGTVLAMVAASLFLVAFADLKRYAPRMRIAILVVIGIVIANGLMSLLPFSFTLGLARALINPLLIISGPLLLAAALVAFIRGSRYAGYFVVGWTPLLVLTVLNSAQVFGVLDTWTWLADACIAAAAFEAIVLSFGLADRTLVLRRDRERIQRLAETDPLTSVFNRRVWTERAEASIESCRRQRQPLSVLFLDLDNFKTLNDRRSHAAGDTALRLMAELMRQHLPPDTPVGRYGGEEFVAALPGCTKSRAMDLAENLRKQLEEAAIPVGDHDKALTLSIGVTEKRDDETLSALVDRADKAMYAAKAAGRNRVMAA